MLLAVPQDVSTRRQLTRVGERFICQDQMYVVRQLLQEELLKKKTGRVTVHQSKHFVHEHRWFAVAEAIHTQKSRCPCTSAEAEGTDEELLDTFVLVVGWRMTKEVDDVPSRVLI